MSERVMHRIPGRKPWQRCCCDVEAFETGKEVAALRETRRLRAAVLAMRRADALLDSSYSERQRIALARERLAIGIAEADPEGEYVQEEEG